VQPCTDPDDCHGARARMLPADHELEPNVTDADPTAAPAADPTAAPGTVHSVREIEALLPHRWPFLLVDRIVEYDPEAKRIVGIKGVTATEWFFGGHFPGLPVMPGVLQVEALAQTMAVYVAKQPGFGDRIGLFAGIDEVRFKRVVVPGDILRLEVVMEKLGSRFGKGRGTATVNGEVACEGLLSFVIPPAGVLR
jgi:3-hydroxyacyl-[acyl-carrier-protein] dehydratase